MEYRIGTRGSRLALSQAEYVRERLQGAYPEDAFTVQVIKTRGDMILDKPLHQIGDKGVFVKEIEEKLLLGEIHIGVHSMKDMPSAAAEGLTFARAWKREDYRDVLILREGASLEDLPKGAVIGTGSRRREFQLKRLRPDIKVVGIRGNVDTRLKKMEEEKLDGLVLAAAGLKRLGMEDRITRYLEVEEMIPAPAQGILGLEILESNTGLLEMLNRLSDKETVEAVKAERGFLQEMGGSCHIPAGAVCRNMNNHGLCLDVMYGNETGSRQAYAKVWGDEPDMLSKKAAVSIRRQIAGKVYLVGAGPGDAGLITVKGLKAIREAACIIYDRLAAPELLKEAKADCEIIYAGKARDAHTMKQEDINRLLVKKSMEYERIVRLKGGDAYVFGRGGEEGIYLQEAGVPFEVIPGISSAIAGPEYAGIPVTHRGIAQGFHVVTAHNSKDTLSEIDFEALAKEKETCVFLMGLSKVDEIARRLIEAGKPSSAMAAVISKATTPKQRTCVSDLSHIGGKVKEAGLTSPAVIVVGDVVCLRDKLDYFEKKPLFGKKYLIPKIGAKTTGLKELLQEKGADVTEIRVGEIVKKKKIFSAEQLKSVDWLLFTSKNGVEAAFLNFVESGLDLRSLGGCRIGVIGAKSAEALQAYGIYADLLPADFNSDGLVEALKPYLTGKEKVWYFKAENADGHLKEALEAFCRFEEIVVYENCGVEVDLGDLEPLAEYNGILFTCASSVKRLMEALHTRRNALPEHGNEKTEKSEKSEKEEKTGENKRGCNIYSIGPKTTACLKSCGRELEGIENIWEARQASYEGLAELCVATSASQREPIYSPLSPQQS